MRRALLLTGLCLVLAGCGVSSAEMQTGSRIERSSASSRSAGVKPRKIQPLVAQVQAEAVSSASSSAPSVVVTVAKPPALPPAVQLEVPFTSQAPHRNWDEPYQNACEEASLLMLMHYMEDRPFTKELADREIVDFTAKVAEMGYGTSITMQQLADITRTLYPQYEPTLVTDVSAESIKKTLADGKPVIIPAAGKKLNNPYFSAGGPWYHMLVITGYDGQFFYTNDPGTGVGYRYPYPQDLLVDSIHDWTGVDEDIEQGRKVMMTLKTR